MMLRRTFKKEPIIQYTDKLQIKRQRHEDNTKIHIHKYNSLAWIESMSGLMPSLAAERAIIISFHLVQLELVPLQRKFLCT